MITLCLSVTTIVNSKSWHIGQVDTDYIAAADGNGISARAQYNVWDNVSVVAKYAYAMKAESHKVVGEMTIGF